MIEILLHFLTSAHALEAGIVATNAWLVKATYTAIDPEYRPHVRFVRLCRRPVRVVVLRVRHQHRLRLVPVELAELLAAQRLTQEVLAHHRAKFLED